MSPRALCVVGIPEAVCQDLPEAGTSLLDGTEGPQKSPCRGGLSLTPTPCVLSTCCLPPPQLWPPAPSGQAWRCHPACSPSSLGDYSGNHPQLPCALGLPPMSAILRVLKAKSQLGVHQPLTSKAQPDTTVSACSVLFSARVPYPLPTGHSLLALTFLLIILQGSAYMSPLPGSFPDLPWLASVFPLLLRPPVSLSHALSLGSRCLSIFLAWSGCGKQSGHPHKPEWTEVDGGWKDHPTNPVSRPQPTLHPKPWLGPHS